MIVDTDVLIALDDQNPDATVAATGLAYNEPVVSTDDDFTHVEGLQVETVKSSIRRTDLSPGCRGWSTAARPPPVRPPSP